MKTYPDNFTKQELAELLERALNERDEERKATREARRLAEEWQRYACAHGPGSALPHSLPLPWEVKK